MFLQKDQSACIKKIKIFVFSAVLTLDKTVLFANVTEQHLICEQNIFCCGLQKHRKIPPMNYFLNKEGQKHA